MEKVKEQIQKMISIVGELEADFPGRHFTLDGHPAGSIGEVMAKAKSRGRMPEKGTATITGI